MNPVIGGNSDSHSGQQLDIPAFSACEACGGRGHVLDSEITGSQYSAVSSPHVPLIHLSSWRGAQCHHRLESKMGVLTRPSWILSSWCPTLSEQLCAFLELAQSTLYKSSLNFLHLQEGKWDLFAFLPCPLCSLPQSILQWP